MTPANIASHAVISSRARASGTGSMPIRSQLTTYR